VTSLKSGALDFLQKPFDAGHLLRQIHLAIAQDTRNREQRKQQAQLDELLATLAPREREVLDLMVEGVSTKSIARQLGTSTDTVRNQRSSVLKKMKVDSTVELTRMVTLLLSEEPPLDQPAGVSCSN
jgi:RNA polymerase sigma factor (sigma-70 family)